jgi:hypothetical protein
MICDACIREYHTQCELTAGVACECTHEVKQATPAVAQELEVTDAHQDVDGSWRKTNRAFARGSRSKYKRDAALKDQQSTGRKRAAVRYPLDRNAPCEWRGLADTGGGLHPILGCTNGKQKDRHHGPDKAVTNNEPGNVHRICGHCHHLWHARNNEAYNWQSTVHLLHSPRPMTDDEWWEALERDVKRKEKKLKRIRD